MTSSAETSVRSQLFLRLTNSLALALSLVSVVVANRDFHHHCVIWGRDKGFLHLLHAGGLVNILRSGWIEVSNLTEILLSLRVATCIDKSLVTPGVFNNLECHQIRLELKKVIHHCGRGAAELLRAEVIELVEPDFLDSQLDLLERVVLHGFRDEFCGHFDVLIRGCTGCDFIQELAEINTDWKIDQNLLVQTSVVISVDRLDILEFSESSEWVRSAHELLDGSVRLETLNNEDNVVDLVPVKHHDQELVQWV